MNIVDILIILSLALFLFFGAKRGMIKELLGLTGWILAVLMALKFGGLVSDLLAARVPGLKILSSVLAFFLVLAGVRIGFLLFAQVIKKVLVKGIIENVDRSVGALFGLFQGAFLVSLLAVAISLLPPNPDIIRYQKGSVLYPYIAKFSVVVINAVTVFIPQAEKAVDSLMERFDVSGETRETIENAAEKTKDVIKSTNTELTPEEIAKILENEKKRTEKSKKAPRR
jgi:membrane protein required for colicin V production